MKDHRIFISLSAGLLWVLALLSIDTPQLVAQSQRRVSPERWRVMSYNVENLFDTIDNPHKQDDEFTPSGAKQWSKTRYRRKLNALSEVIRRSGEAQWPALVGLIEVENSEVLSDLTRTKGLRKAGYEFALSNGLDERGINVALMWRSQLFSPDTILSIRPDFTGLPDKKTRDILYVSGQTKQQVRLHVFILHLPSRRGGAKLTDPYREAIASQVRTLCDSIVAEEGNGAHILIMGDMNAYLDESPMSVGFGLAKSPPLEQLTQQSSLEQKTVSLYCPTAEPNEQGAPGSYCYRGVWGQIDHVLLSRAFYDEDSPLVYVQGSMQNYAPAYMQSDKVHAGVATPLTTYAGPHYQGGYSDHYPVILDFLIRPKSKARLR